MNTHFCFAFVLAFLSVIETVRSDEPIVIKSALVTLIDQVEVPAREAGILGKTLVREGQFVETGELLTTIDDKRTRLARNHAEIELQNAKHRAANDVSIRLAEKSRELATVELKRALSSRERFAKSVSQSELDRLKLAVEKATLDIENAKHDFDAAKLAVQLSENNVRVAEDDLARRRVLSPIDGLVVQINRKQGEWVQPGNPLLRIVRMDRLRVEGLLAATYLTNDLLDRKARFLVNLPKKGVSQFAARIVFVFPEINKINGQVRIWSEVENADGLLKPGMLGTLTIEPREVNNNTGAD